MAWFGKHKKDKDDVLRDNHDAEVKDDYVSLDGDDKEKKSRFSVTKWVHFDRHRVIERRIFYFGLALAVLATGAGVAYFHSQAAARKEAQTLTTTGTQVSFSQTTTAQLTLHATVLNADRTTAYIPVSFNDMTSLSTKANNYQLFISSTSGALSYRPTGLFTMFGDTGRAVIVIHNAAGIMNQPVTLYIRNDKKLSADDANTSMGSLNSDDGFSQAQAKYDILRFKVNPGAAGIKRDKTLSGPVSPKDLYKHLYGDHDIKVVEKANRTLESQIKIDMAKASEYRHRLTTEGFKVPDDPAWMKSDWRPYDAVSLKTGLGRNVDPNGDGKIDSTTSSSGSSSSSSASSASSSSDSSSSSAASGSDNQQAQAAKNDAEASSSSAAGSSDTSTMGTNSSDPDSVNFPATLYKADGTSTDDNSNQGAVTGGTDNSGTVNGINGSSQTPADSWSSLVNAWNDIKSCKRSIYVTNAKALYTVYDTIKSQTEIASVGSERHFGVIGEVNISATPSTTSSKKQHKRWLGLRKDD